MAKALPEQVEDAGEQISGGTATVFIRLPRRSAWQEVSLVRIDGKWRVGDRETYQLVVREGRSFFFNARLRVGEAEAYEWLLEIVGAQAIHFSSKQPTTARSRTWSLWAASPSTRQRERDGYRFRLAVSEDGKGYRVHAVPAEYGRTGRLSFSLHQTNAIRAEDKEGQPAAATAPLTGPKKTDPRRPRMVYHLPLGDHLLPAGSLRIVPLSARSSTVTTMANHPLSDRI